MVDPGSRATSQASAALPPSAVAARYRAVLFDLDGVLYLGDQVVPMAPATLTTLRRAGVGVGFVTNNSASPPRDVAARLSRFGIGAAPEEIVTSAMAAVHLLGGPEAIRGTPVLVVGGTGLREALAGAGAELLEPAAWGRAQIVVVGFDPELRYESVRAAALALAAGARFVGSNADVALPTPEGPVPGAGATLAMLEAATERRPTIAGKPEPAMFETAAEAFGGKDRMLVVGDRSDTDLEGAARLGWDTALVLTGITHPATLAELDALPTYVLPDVGGLLEAQPPPIRPAGADDAAAIVALFEAAGRSAERVVQRISATLVAEAPDGLAGAIATEQHGDTALLRALVVRERDRDRLIGTRLVAEACRTLRRARVRSVAVWASAGEGFFRRLGFVRVEPTQLGGPAALLASAAAVATGATPLARWLPELPKAPPDG